MTDLRQGAIYHPSPNHGERRGGLKPSLVVLHYTAMPSAALALERLCDPAWEVSAHWLIGRTGRLWSLVPEQRRAWHAGAGSWGGLGDVNSRSIGIEIDNDGSSPFTAPAMERLAELLDGVLSRWNLPSEAVIGHSDMAPLRKSDPGPRFDWLWLAKQGLSVWPKTVSAGPAPWQSAGDKLASTSLGADLAVADRSEGDGPCVTSGPAMPGADSLRQGFLSAAERFGYPVNAGLPAVLTAFRLRFRGGMAGPLDEDDLALIGDLAERFPSGSSTVPELPRLAGS